MLSGKVLARLLVPAATVVVEKIDSTNCRPSELPIYTPDEVKDAKKPTHDPNVFEKQIGNVRKQVMSLTGEVDRLREAASGMYEDTINQAEWLVNYLAEEENTTPKAGAIAVGGLTGLILGLRGGFFRKLVFTSAGALGMASLCYPKEASEYSAIAISEIKKYIKIGYNFYHGVKKDDPPLELPSLPKLPVSLSETWDLMKSVTKSDKSVTDGMEFADEVIAVTEVDDGVEIDPVDLITRAYEESNNEDCHCPIGTCLNPKDEADISQFSNPVNLDDPDDKPE